MQTVNIHEAKTQLSKLLVRAASGETVVIAKAGKPIARLTAFEPAQPVAKNRFGFLAGRISVPEDFNTMASGEIEDIFQGGQ